MGSFFGGSQYSFKSIWNSRKIPAKQGIFPAFALYHLNLRRGYRVYLISLFKNTLKGLYMYEYLVLFLHYLKI